MLTWFADLAMVQLVMYAVGIDLPIGAGLLVLFTLNLTIAVPSTPAQVGALEAGVLAATRLLAHRRRAGVRVRPALSRAADPAAARRRADHRGAADVDAAYGRRRRVPDRTPQTGP